MTVTLLASLTDVMVSYGALKRESGTTEDLEQPSNKKRKVAKNFATTTTTKQTVPTRPQLAHKSYSGTAPFCNKCNYHHQPDTGCRQCTYCGKMGHWAKFCKNQATQHKATQMTGIRWPTNQYENNVKIGSLVESDTEKTQFKSYCSVISE
ncbi:hypothetical protein E3N88_12079 [Mikania micrantha]|uniref:CCHC-type domain-containing protein n=1 Tax=Mikania micrantha TaxID=192012 RepID=A0A5N6P4H4_9ASTR|nr:hypothetical protein E3N88_12079 [Mikania micrantha]